MSKRKDKIETAAIGTDAVATDSPRDIAFSSWLSDVEEYLLKTFGRNASQSTKLRVGELIGHNPELGWQSDPNDKYNQGGAKFSSPAGVFLELGPYWSHVRSIGKILAQHGLHRALGTLRYGTPSNYRSAPDPAAFAKMREAINACVSSAAAARTVQPKREIGSTRLAEDGLPWSPLRDPQPVGKDAAAGPESEPIDTTDYSEQQP